MKSKKRFTTYEEILNQFNAILQLESKTAQIYEQLAQDCDHPQAKTLLKKIAEKESEHRLIAQKLMELVEQSIKQHLSQTKS